jgi:PAS domain S-box-containing protein
MSPGRSPRPAAEALANASAFHHALLEAAVDAIVTIDESGRIETFNPAAERLFGYAAEEVIGGNVSVLMPSPYREEHDGYLRAYRETGIRKIIGIGREVAARRKDGTQFPMELAVSEARIGGRRIFMGTIRDISARRAAESQLREQRDFLEQLFDIAPGIILVLDPRGRIVRYNRYLEDLTGRPLAEMRGLDAIESLVPMEARAAALDQLSRWRAGDSARDVEVPILGREGQERHVVWSGAALEDPAGAVSAVLAIGLDVTERKILQEELQHSQRMEALGQLAGGVAHDFNTLLGSILGYSELLLEQSRDENLRRAAGAIRASAERGAALSRRLLAFGKRRPMTAEHLDLNELLSGMGTMLQRLIGEGIVLELAPAPVPTFVLADPGLLEQVVVNLVLNAVDAIDGSGTIAVSVTPRDEHSVALEVRDDGCGMTEEVRRRVFEPFFTTKPGKGTGLGLSTVYGIVEQSGGHITVESRRGVGTTFTVLLPRVVAAPSPRTATAVPVATGGHESVLVVEDDSTFRGLVEEVLTAAGYRVQTAESATQALVLATEEATPLDLAICDVGLPDLNGVELARRLQERMPVLLMSGYEDCAGESIDLPLLAKPFRGQELLQKVRQALDRRPGIRGEAHRSET